MGLNSLEVTNLAGGITNVPVSALFASMKQPDSSLYYEDLDNFMTFASGATGPWVVTETQAGATQALTAGHGGLLLLTNSAADNDINQIQRPVANFLPAAGKRLFFRCIFKLSDVTQSDFAIGLQQVNADGTTLATATDGIFFLKADDAATVTLYVRKDNAAGSTNSGAIATLVNDTFVALGFMFDGVDRVYYEVNGTVVGSITLSTAAGFLPDQAVCLMISLKNGEAVAKTATIDHIYVAMER